MVHTYRGWKITVPGASDVHFSDQATAVRYFGAVNGPAELTMTLREMPCGIPTRGFCGHCAPEARAYQV